MISKHINKYCKESITAIENYEKAINSDVLYHLHHKNEILLNVSKDELIKMGLYYNRPANELVFLTPSEHISLHNSGEKNGMYGKSISGEQHWHYGLKSGDKTRKKQSEAHKGKKHYNWKDICPLQLYVEYKILHKTLQELQTKYNCSHATLYRRLQIKKTTNNK